MYNNLNSKLSPGKYIQKVNNKKIVVKFGIHIGYSYELNEIKKDMEKSNNKQMTKSTLIFDGTHEF